MDNVQRLAGILGSKYKIAKAAGVAPSLVTRWSKHSSEDHGGYGLIPPKYNRIILDYARENVVELAGEDKAAQDEMMRAVLSCLEPEVCPMCGHALPVHDGEQ